MAVQSKRDIAKAKNKKVRNFFYLFCYNDLPQTEQKLPTMFFASYAQVGFILAAYNTARRRGL